MNHAYAGYMRLCDILSATKEDVIINIHRDEQRLITEQQQKQGGERIMSCTTVNKHSRRFVHLDLLRLLAIFFVIFNHTGERGYILFAQRTETPLYIPYMLFSILCKIAVPLFFMISGALLLNKEESLKKLFTKRILRMAIVLVVVSVPYYFWLHRSNGISITSFFSYIYGNSASTSLWYLYSYIGLLLVLPFLQKMVKNMKGQDFVYLLIGYLVLVGFIPCLEYCLWGGSVTLHPSFSAVLFTTQNIFYALMGYYLEHILDQKQYKTKNIWIAVLLSAAALAITCLLTVYSMSKQDHCTTDQLEAFFNCFICIPTITVYFTVKHLAQKIQRQAIKKWVQLLGSAVFGVYLIEKIMRSATGIVYTTLAPVIGSFAASLVWCVAVLCTSLASIVLLKHIPIIKKVTNKFI